MKPLNGHLWDLECFVFSLLNCPSYHRKIVSTIRDLSVG